MGKTAGACEACHKAKTKCKGNVPCERCMKFRLECIPHVSRQGQGVRGASKKKARTADGLEQSEDAFVLQQLDSQQRDHYGLRYLIHSWISFAVRRRSFSLLARASTLAAKLGITMDGILGPNMDFLPHILLTPVQKQIVLPTTVLRWADIPERLLQATGSLSENGGNRNNRWIWIREMSKGMSRYLLSEAFARTIAPLQLINETWKRNEQPVVDLFLVNRSKHTQAFAHQISLFRYADKQPECSRLNQLKLKTQSQGTIEVDQIACLEIVDMNNSYYFVEYVPTSGTLKHPWNQENDSNVDLTFVNLDELLGIGYDSELQMFLKLMEEENYLIND